MQADIVINGGSFVGVLLAHMLADTNYKVIVVEERKPNFAAEQDDPRGIGLSLSTLNTLKDNGINLSYAKNDIINKVKVSVKGAFGKLYLDAKDGEILGACLQATDILQQFYDQAKLQANNIKLLFGNSITNFVPTAHGWRLTLSEDIVINTRLLIGADGANSKVRAAAQIGAVKQESEQALVASLKISQSHNNQAEQRFLKNAILALLPYGENQFKCIVSSSSPQLLNEIKDDLLNFCSAQVKSYKFIEHGKAHIYPIPQVKAESIVHANSILVGNAAQTLHPLASQGLNLGVRDITQLTWFLRNTTIEHTLENYAYSREADRSNKIKLTENIQQYFAGCKSRSLKSLALLLAELLPPLKHKIMCNSMHLHDLVGNPYE